MHQKILGPVSCIMMLVWPSPQISATDAVDFILEIPRQIRMEPQHFAEGEVHFYGPFRKCSMVTLSPEEVQDLSLLMIANRVATSGWFYKDMSLGKIVRAENLHKFLIRLYNRANPNTVINDYSSMVHIEFILDSWDPYDCIAGFRFIERSNFPTTILRTVPLNCCEIFCRPSPTIIDLTKVLCYWSNPFHYTSLLYALDNPCHAYNTLYEVLNYEHECYCISQVISKLIVSICVTAELSMCSEVCQCIFMNQLAFKLTCSALPGLCGLLFTKIRNLEEHEGICLSIALPGCAILYNSLFLTTYLSAICIEQTDLRCQMAFNSVPLFNMVAFCCCFE